MSHSCCCRLNLGATCTSLRQASLAWFAEVTAVVQPGKTDVALLAAWLERHQGEQLLLGALRKLCALPGYCSQCDCV
jgi:hypothetical protein